MITANVSTQFSLTLRPTPFIESFHWNTVKYSHFPNTFGRINKPSIKPTHAG